MKPRTHGARDSDFGKRLRFRLDGILTGSDAPTYAEREHLQGRAALAILIAVLCDEPTFWRDWQSIRSAIAAIDQVTDDATAQRLTHPAWTLSSSYGVQRPRHRRLISVILLAAAREPTKHTARSALLRLGEHPVLLDDTPRGYARHDVTRLVQGARMVAAYRAGRCGAPDCRQARHGRYCRTHDKHKALERSLKETRQWALNRAADALRSPGSVRTGDYALWLITSKAELAHRG